MPNKRDDRPLLFHSASLGEINAIKPLVATLLSKGLPIEINTITLAGKNEAKRQFPSLEVSLSPLDLAFLKRRQLKRLKPRLILIVETEIWPNMLMQASKQNIPIVFVNARISEKTLQRMKLLKPFMTTAQASVKAIYAQSADDARRFQQLFSCDIQNAGNLKFSAELPTYDNKCIRKKWGFKEEDFILCWGSSRPGEEELILSIYPTLKREIADFKLILAPRHPQRIDEVLGLLDGFGYKRLTEIEQAETDVDILLIDKLGELNKAYSLASLAIVGGSFYDFGGHNPLEPAFYAKPIIIGEYHRSCKDSVVKLKENAAIVISNPLLLSEDIINLAFDKTKRKEMGERAKLVLTENAMSLANHIRGIEEWLN